MLFGFGDEENPDPHTLALLEVYLEEFIQNITLRAYNSSLRQASIKKTQININIEAGLIKCN
jgi:hypothetical protein